MLVGRYCIPLGMKRSVNDSSIGLMPLFGGSDFGKHGFVNLGSRKIPECGGAAIGGHCHRSRERPRRD